MALTADDCLYPRWVLKAEVLWPGMNATKVREILDELVRQAIAVAAVLSAPVQFEAARWYTAYRAYDGRTLQLEGLASTIDVRDEGSRSFYASQMEKMAARRDDALARYEAIVAGDVAVDEVLVSPPIRQSRTVIASFEF